MPVSEPACVVCGAAIPADTALYANTWERSRKRFPCCSPACAARFHPDSHWIPSPRAAVLGDEQGRLRQLARSRLAGLDQARPVVRELLQAGLDPAALRALVAESRAANREQQRRSFWRTVLGVALAPLRGRAAFAEARDPRTQASFAEAIADLDQWDAGS